MSVDNPRKTLLKEAEGCPPVWWCLRKSRVSVKEAVKNITIQTFFKYKSAKIDIPEQNKENNGGSEN